MKTKHLLLTASFVFGMTSMAASQATIQASASHPTTTRAAKPIFGKWAGTFQGSGNGQMFLTFNQGQNGKTTGEIAIQPEGAPEFPSITFEFVTVEGNHIKATFTDWEGTKAQLEGDLENHQLQGSWKTGGGQGGTWQTAKAK